MEETEVVKFRVGKKEKAELEKLAEKNERTLAGEIRFAISSFLKGKKSKA